MMCNRCEELEEEVTQLKARLYGAGWEPPAELRLTCHETVILQTLLAHDRLAPHWMLYEATRSAPKARDNDVDPKIIQIRVCHLRAKLRPFGLEIETVWGRGYRLKPDTRWALSHWDEHMLREAA